MEKLANVIANFNTAGRVRPLWLQFDPLEETLPIKILEATTGQAESSSGRYMTYICKVKNKYNNDIEIKLRHYKKEDKWYAIYNNSTEF